MTYADLIRDIPISLLAQNRTLVDEMPMVIRRAEDEIILRLDHDAFRSVLPNLVTLTPGDNTLNVGVLGFDVLEVRSLRLDYQGVPVILERRGVERMEAIYPTFEQGVPRFYAEDSAPLLFRVFPWPDSVYSVAVHANLAPQRLGPGQQTNLLTSRFPRLMEMAALKQGAIFMRNPADEARYTQLLDLALAEANSALERRRRDEGGVKVRSTSNIAG